MLKRKSYYHDKLMKTENPCVSPLNYDQNNYCSLGLFSFWTNVPGMGKAKDNIYSLSYVH